MARSGSGIPHRHGAGGHWYCPRAALTLDQFQDPDPFDPTAPTLSTSATAAASTCCFGAPLARVETQVALPQLTRRLVNPRLVADPPPYRPNPVLCGPATSSSHSTPWPGGVSVIH